MTEKLENTVEKLVKQCIKKEGFYKIEISGSYFCPLFTEEERSGTCPYLDKPTADNCEDKGLISSNLYRCIHEGIELIPKINKKKDE